MADVKKLAEELTKLTVLEVNELKNVLKDEYGIEPAAAAVAVAAGPAADAGAAADEKTEFTVNLLSLIHISLGEVTKSTHVSRHRAIRPWQMVMATDLSISPVGNNHFMCHIQKL